MADRAYGRPGPETDTDLEAVDWYGADLTGHTAERTRFRRADLVESTSTGGTVFTDCVFRDCHFDGADLTAAGFLNCTFSGCDFSAARFTDCKFVGSMFERCEFGRLTVTGGDWSFIGLPGADLRSVTMTRVRMHEADLTGARCDGATLRDLDLARAMTGRASFARADLRGSDLAAIDPWSCDLSRAVVDWQQAVTVAMNLGLDVRPD